MMLAKGTVINLERLWFDPMTYFPHGTSLHFGPFNSWCITIFSYIFGLGHPSMHLVEVVGAFLPAVLGVLLILPVYFIGRELGGKSCGLISALIVAVLPGQILSRTTLGFTDHHGAEILLSTLTMMFFFMAMRTGKSMTFGAVQKNWSSLKLPLMYSVLAGVSLGLYIDAWSSGFLFEGIILLFILLQSMVDHLKERNVEYLGVSGAITFFVATLLVLPFVKPYNGFNHYLYSLFLPTILLLGVVAVIVLALLSKFIQEKGFATYYYPGAAIAIVILGTIILSLVAPQFIHPLFTGLNIFQAKTGGAATVGEASPLLYYQGELSWASVLSNFPALGNLPIFSSFFLALAGMVLVLYRYIKSQRSADLLLLTWSLMLLVMTLAQNRFAYYYGVNVALLTGYLAFWLMKRGGVDDLDALFLDAKEPAKLLASNLKLVASALLIFLFLIYPALSTSLIVAQYAGGPDSDWLTSTAWLQNNTPSPGMDLYEKYEYPPGGKYEYPAAAYGIMSWWDYGNLIETIGHRIPNANPFQQGIGSIQAGIAGSSPFFLAENESRAEKVLADLDVNRSSYLNTKYVIIDRDMATGKFHAMAAWSGIPTSKYMAAVYQEQGSSYVPVQIWREPYFKSMTARMFFFDGTQTAGDQGIGIAYRGMSTESGVTVPVLTQAPKITSNRAELAAFVNESKNSGDLAEIAAMSPANAAFPLEALHHYRLVHESETPVTSSGQKYVKIFEHVPGAVIKGTAPAGTNVTAAVVVMTNQNRAFVYQQSNTTDASGQFTLTVPYSTDGPAANGTNFDTKPLGSYQIAICDKTMELNVPEEKVLTGAEIDI
ncbi:Dolichyl-monophosphooligosaccharide--protein glycotransferase AglB [uncultured archaeon]|nr:Dolichyl-monophosphooligosaccharide--protein glycotransferase AglB [uncultured archaeon]